MVLTPAYVPHWYSPQWYSRSGTDRTGMGRTRRDACSRRDKCSRHDKCSRTGWRAFYNSGMSFSSFDASTLRAMLDGVKTIAVVGFSPKPQRPSHGIARAMQLRGFRIIPVRPGISEGLGEKAYATLAELPASLHVDLVNVFRNGAEVMPVVDACIRLGLKKIWMQEGCINEEAAQKAHAAGMRVVMDRCIFRDYKKLGLDSLTPPTAPTAPTTVAPQT